MEGTTDSLERRKALIEQMRSHGEESQAGLFQKTKSKRQAWEEPAEEDIGTPSFSMWKVKFFIAMFLFIGFLVLDTLGISFYKIDSKAVEASVKQNIKTEEVSNFVKEQISGITGL